MVAPGRAVKERSKCRPAEAKNSGTNSPSDALRIPGRISCRTRSGMPDREMPNTSAPMVPCRPIISAPTTIRNSPPIISPNDSSGTLSSRCMNSMAGGSTRVDSSQVTITNAAICPSRIGMRIRLNS